MIHNKHGTEVKEINAINSSQLFVLIIARYYLRQIDLLGIITSLAIITLLVVASNARKIFIAVRLCFRQRQ